LYIYNQNFKRKKLPVLLVEFYSHIGLVVAFQGQLVFHRLRKSIVSKFTKTKPAKPKASGPKGPLPPLPRKDVIRVVQFQYFDNGPNPGSGKSRYAMTVEVYMQDRLTLLRPDWKRSVALLDPDQVKSWADGQVESGKLSAGDHEFYEALYRISEGLIEQDDVEWVKIGYIEDRRAKIRYPGQALLLSREMTGKFTAYLFSSAEEYMETSSFQYDRNARPGSGRRLFYGFYDPAGMYAAMKAERALQAKADCLAASRGDV
jgi:hypothetical protein